MLLLWDGLFLVLFPLHSPGDGDLCSQRWLGDPLLHTHQLPAALGNETFTANGAPWVPQEWILSAIIVAGRGSRRAAALAANPTWKRTFRGPTYVVQHRV